MTGEPLLSDDWAGVALATAEMLELRVEGVAFVLVIGLSRGTVELEKQSASALFLLKHGEYAY
jgi:hypothetical protein